MKSFILSLIIGVLVVAGTTFYTHQIEIVSEELLEDNREIIRLLEDDNYSEASVLTKKMAELVNKKKLSLALIMDHGDLDKIEMGIAELEGYVNGEIQTDAIAKCNTLDVMIRHMPKNHKLKLENIL